MPSPGVGDDIEDSCSRCGDSWHVVMAKLNDRIAKVVCKRCGSQHNYRGGSAGLDAPPEPASTTPATTGRRVVRKRPARAAANTPPPTPEFDPSKPPRPYSARDTYGTGERIVHPTFGTGVVAGTPGPGKVDVVFPEGARTLACAKAESTLARPTAVASVPIADRPPPKL
jgi:ribosomal protein S27AE